MSPILGAVAYRWQSGSGEGIRSTALTTIQVGLLRELFRNLVAFRNLYEDTGQDIITGPEGIEFSLWDLEHLYEHLHLLPTRQAQAIELCLVGQFKEREAAVIMGVSITNPVAMYATDGLKNLVRMIDARELRAFSSPNLAVA